MLKYGTLLGVALLMAACTTPEQKAARMQAEMDRMMRSYGPACQQLGFAPQTDQWRNCVLQLSDRDEADRRFHPYWHGGYARSRWSLGGSWGW